MFASLKFRSYLLSPNALSFLPFCESLYSTSAPSRHVNCTAVLFVYYSPLCYFCHHYCCACFCYVASILPGSAMAVGMGGGRVLMPNSTTNGCLASSDWQRLEGSWCWCGGGSCRGPSGFVVAVWDQLTAIRRVRVTILMTFYSIWYHWMDEDWFLSDWLNIKPCFT